MDKKLLFAGIISMFLFVSGSTFSQDFLQSPEEILMDFFQLTEEETQMVILHIEEIKAQRIHLEEGSLMEEQEAINREMKEEALRRTQELMEEEALAPIE